MNKIVNQLPGPGAYEHEEDIVRDQILKVSPDYMPFPMPHKDISFPRTGMYGPSGFQDVDTGRGPGTYNPELPKSGTMKSILGGRLADAKEDKARDN